MPLYEVVLEQEFAGQQIINRFNYLGSGTPAAVTGSFALVSAIGGLPTSTSLGAGTLMRAIQNLQCTNVRFVQIMARAIFLDEDFYASPFLASTYGLGAPGSSALSPIDSYGFRSNRVKQSIGRGFKRFVGVSEDNISAGGNLYDAGVTLSAIVKDELGAALEYDDEGNTLAFAPCIAQKEKYTTPSGKSAYRYYATELLQAPHLAVGISWENYPQIRSQVSRQYGRGS